MATSYEEFRKRIEAELKELASTDVSVDVDGVLKVLDTLNEQVGFDTDKDPEVVLKQIFGM